uniref:von Willebrand factor A domain containing 5A n=1 Tax=Salarias fasciatus TaxID=181472 RepID=A0A672HYB8_SALFA
ARHEWESMEVPLKSVEVELEVRDHVATVVSTLNYQNKEDKPIEAVFVFPLPGDAAVCHFSAKMGQKEIVAEVKEKQEAREEYDDALSSGQQAFLLEESDQSPDVFSMRVGCLPPGESASIRLEYVTELAVQADEGLRFCLPAVLNPRYTPQGSEAPAVQVNSVPASLVPYSLSFSARVSSPRPISKVESSCSLDPLQFLNTDQTQATVKLGAGHKFDRDVEVLIYYKDAHQPTAVVEAGQASAKPGTLMGDPVVMVSLFPEFPQSVMSSVASCGEFVFLMDRSGSMDFPMNNKDRSQTRISSARETLLLLLKSLPMGCYFNIYSFGCSFEHIFPKSVEYSQQTMEEALKIVGTMEADLGGTQILKALKHIYEQPCIPSQPRQLFIFTDGEVGDTKEVIDLVKKNSASHRCFSFGIGEGASSALINGLAKEGGGQAQFITGSDRMQPKVMQSLRFALQPAVVDISITWDLPKDVSVTVLSPPITALFQAPSCHGKVFISLDVHYINVMGLLCKRSLEMTILYLQLTGVKEKVVALSIQSGVSSCFTAFIAVNKGDGEAIQGPLVRRNDVESHNMLFSCLNYVHPFHTSWNFISLLFSHFRVKCLSPSLSPRHGYGAADSTQPEVKPPPCDPLLQLVSLQNASGFWMLDSALAAALGKTSEEVEKSKPEPVSHCQRDSEVWATILALIWLQGFQTDAKDEWQILAGKAVLWLQAQNGTTTLMTDCLNPLLLFSCAFLSAPNVTECVDAGNALLGCRVQKDALGL